MSVATGLALAAVGTTAAISANQQKKAGKAAAAGQAAGAKGQLDFYRQQAGEYQEAIRKAISEGQFEFPSVDAGAAADQSLDVTTRNLPGVIKNTESVYNAASANVNRFIRESFGQDAAGKDILPQAKEGASNIVLDQLKGRLAPGTRTLLGRQALATGAVNLGEGAVQDAFTYKLGLAAEEQAQRGVENYSNLYQTYGRFAPNITPLNLLPYGGLETGQAIQNAQFNAQGEFQGQLAEVQAILGGITQETGTVGPSIGPSIAGPYMVRAAGYQGDAGVTEAIGSTVSSLFGAYGAAQAAGQYGSIYGSTIPSQLAPGEAAYNRSNGITDRTVSGYYGGGGSGSLGGGAFGQSGAFGGSGNSSNSILALLKQMRQLTAN